MKTMTESEWRSFLSFGTRTAKLATRHPDGRPDVAPIWFVLDANDLVFTTQSDTVKGKNLRHDLRVMLAVGSSRQSSCATKDRVTINGRSAER